MDEDRTNTTRQQRRRLREKEWLAGHGWSSWESLHTALMNGSASLVPEYTEPPAFEKEAGPPPRDPARTVKFLWKADEAAGETAGKRQEIRILTEGSFHRFVRGTLPPGTAGNLPEYLSRYPGNTHYSVTWGEEDTDWRLSGAGGQEELLREPRASPLAVEVGDFSSPEAINWGKANE
jgi:hypothetical protein